MTTLLTIATLAAWVYIGAMDYWVRKRILEHTNLADQTKARLNNLTSRIETQEKLTQALITQMEWWDREKFVQYAGRARRIAVDEVFENTQKGGQDEPNN